MEEMLYVELEADDVMGDAAYAGTQYMLEVRVYHCQSHHWVFIYLF
jgi:hypothetical protein